MEDTGQNGIWGLCGSNAWWSTAPVSYTHLDVYKRQLVERIITMLTEDDPPVDVDKLLIVTFTEAAASEMKERIRLAIEKKLLEYPEDEHLKQQATLIHNAQITTIHSFCLSVIRCLLYTSYLMGSAGAEKGEDAE